MPDDIRKLATDAIKELLSCELGEHSQHGWGDYRMREETVDLVRRAHALGLGPLEPYEGYSYLGQAKNALVDE